MSPALIVIGSVELAVLAVLVAVLVRRRRGRSDVSGPPSQMQRLLDDHRDDVPLRTPTEDDDENEGEQC